jgi:hypothetical protein
MKQLPQLLEQHHKSDQRLGSLAGAYESFVQQCEGLGYMKWFPRHRMCGKDDHPLRRRVWSGKIRRSDPAFSPRLPASGGSGSEFFPCCPPMAGLQIYVDPDSVYQSVAL